MNLEGFDLEENDVRTFERTYEELSKRFEVEIIDCDKIDNLFPLIKFLRSFQLLNHYKDFEIINIFNLNPKSENIKIINVYISFLSIGGKGSTGYYGDLQNLGLTEINYDFGHALMTQETTADKIVDIFIRQDVDFRENQLFSDKFYLVGTDKEQLRRKFNLKIQNQLLKYPDINIEIKNNILIGKSYKSMGIKNTINIAETIKVIKEELKNGA